MKTKLPSHTMTSLLDSFSRLLFLQQNPAKIVKLRIQMFELNECVVGRRKDFLTHF